MDDTNLKIQKNLTFIKEHVTHIDMIVDKLIENEVIPSTERDTIMCNKSVKDQIQNVLDMVTRKQKGTDFLRFLEETSNTHVAERITNTKISDNERPIRSETFIKDYASTPEISAESKLSKELNNTQEELKRVKLERDQKISQITIIKDQLENKVTRLKLLNATSIESNRKCEQLENEKIKLEAENKELAKRIEEAENFRQEAVGCMQDSDNLRHEIEDLQKQLVAKENEITELKTNIVSLKEEGTKQKELKEDVAELKKENETMKTDISEIKQNLSTVSENLLLVLANQTKAKESEKQNTRSRPIIQHIPWQPTSKTNPQRSRYGVQQNPRRNVSLSLNNFKK